MSKRKKKGPLCLYFLSKTIMEVSGKRFKVLRTLKGFVGC